MEPRRNLKIDEMAQVGIGTMIVFIATVLVAAIAAGVLISTSSDLQEKSTRTGREATEQVASNLNVESVVGTRALATDDLNDLQIFVSLAPGASQVDLAQMRIQITDGSTQDTLDYVTGGTPDTDSFATTEVRDADGSFDDAASTPVMTAGDLVRIDIDLDSVAGINMELAERTDVEISLIPEVGSSVPIGFTTPNSYGTKLIIELA